MPARVQKKASLGYAPAWRRDRERVQYRTARLETSERRTTPARGRRFRRRRPCFSRRLRSAGERVIPRNAEIAFITSSSARGRPQIACSGRRILVSLVGIAKVRNEPPAKAPALASRRARRAPGKHRGSSSSKSGCRGPSRQAQVMSAPRSRRASVARRPEGAVRPALGERVGISQAAGLRSDSPRPAAPNGGPGAVPRVVVVAGGASPPLRPRRCRS